MIDAGNRRSLGLFTLVALVIGNMIGAGVFTTSGFAIADLGSPALVLLAWVIGGMLALCGAISYGALGRLMPVSGGEYYFLSRAVHPLVGFIAGWVSLWAGFTAAIAFAAITFEAYWPLTCSRCHLPGNSIATAVILLAALCHGLQVRQGAIFQNIAVVLKLVLIIGFIAFALLGSDISQWSGVQAWRKAEPAQLSIPAFAMTLMWISFSYSGFNASVYVASEVPDASRNVPRAMLIATVIVSLVYLLLNAIFVFAPLPAEISGQEEVAAIAAGAVAGETLAALVRGIIAVALFTSVSAMIMAGPRVYAQMASDGLMPASLRLQGEVPGAAIAMQAALSIAVVWLSGLRELLSYLGFTLGLSTVVTVASLFVIVRRGTATTEKLPGYPWAPAIFVACTLVFTGLAAIANPVEMLAAVLTLLSAVLVYWLFGRKHQKLEKLGTDHD